ncbi:uncharacterized protein LOC142559639 [Dermacentor variabilis]|uniref:uncharacterized protein LOC142559639 n=1 Tax=Dermacentor variabilis TaxID=34621 RepID=UPI003F5C472E
MMFLYYLSCVFTLVSASSHSASEPFKYAKPNFTDLLEALNTSEKIWMKQRNYAVSQDCIYWERIFLNRTDYFFYQWERKGKMWTKYEERAKLINGTDVPVMKIRLKAEQESKGRPYNFEYWTSEEKCFILKYTGSSAISMCEQHVWNSKVATTTGECDKAFQTICGGVSYQIYKRSCIDPDYICVGLKSRC